MRIISGTRTYNEQNTLYTQGRNRPVPLLATQEVDAVTTTLVLLGMLEYLIRGVIVQIIIKNI